MILRRLFHLFRVLVAWLILPALAIVIWGELRPVQDGPEIIWDKLLHFTAYFGLCLMATISVRARPRATLYCMASLALMGGMLEVIQTMVGRDGDILDETANAIGIVAGALCGWMGIAILRHLRLVEARPRD